MNDTKRRKPNWVGIAIVIALFSYCVWGAYDYFRLDLHNLPELSENEFSLAFTNGLRGIMVDIVDERHAVEPDQRRKYIGFEAAKAPEWFKGSWSYCKAPSEKKSIEIERSFDPGPGARLDAVCSFDADGEIIPAGIVYSVPDL